MVVFLMITIDPIKHALVPADSAAADALGAPNYDEFQSDAEVWELLQQRPASVLRVSMPHCHVRSAASIEAEESQAALERARRNMEELRADERTREVSDILWIYQITRPDHPHRAQIGLGGMARTDEIRTPENPAGSIIRNEGIREKKARGRAVLTEATRADLGTVNLAVDDADGVLQAELQSIADDRAPTFETTDEMGNRHRVWIVENSAERARLRAVLQQEPHAYVADGNHRSAAAAMLGYEHYLAVFFPAATMTIAPYNRLVKATGPARAAIVAALHQSFELDPWHGGAAYQPNRTHEIGFYDGERWWQLRPRSGTFDPGNAAQDIDADIVQRNFFAKVLGITEPGDDRLTFVGANRDANWLQEQVDAGRFAYALTLPPVTMEQFVAVCLQDRLMPPKSTWFVPKIRSGLVIALLD
jgi:uncharacterized protein (DUF1015 family)